MIEITKRLKPGHLLAGWCVYWGTLAVATLWRPALALWRVTRPGADGSASASFGDSEISFLFSKGGEVVLEQSAAVSHVAAWIAVPPLLMLGGWMYLRSRAQRTPHAPHVDALPAASEPMSPIRVRKRERSQRPITPLP